MENKLQVFDIKSMNEELEDEFHNFFHKYNLLPLFTNEHRSTKITVSDNELRATVNEGGVYHKVLKDFADYLLWASDNKSYEEAIFKIIYESRSMQGLVNNIKKIKAFIETGIDVNHMFNLWNIVFYTKDIK